MRKEIRQAFFRKDGIGAGALGGGRQPRGKKDNDGKKRGRPEDEKKRRENSEALAGLIVVFLIFAVAVVNIILPDKEFSERENRMLAQMPELSSASLADGRFMTHSESYLADQFLFRDLWISIRSRFQLLMGVSDSNGVYRGERGYMFQASSEPDEEHLSANIDSINQLAEDTNLRIFMMVVPTAPNVLSDYLPKFAPMSDQNADLMSLQQRISSNIKYIDTYDALKEHESEYIYYYTDHHWTTKGAYYAFLRAAPDIGIANPEEIEYSRVAVTDSFAGTLASKSGFPLKKKDTIEVWIPSEDAEAAGVLLQEAEGAEGTEETENAMKDAAENGSPEDTTADETEDGTYSPSIRYVVEYVEEDQKSVDLYDSSKLDSADKYAVFFGGNYPLIKISTTNQTDKSPLLIFKDSYANCFVPFLLPYYDEIIMVDPRYYYDDIGELIRTEKISQILFLYNADTFFEDTSLADVLAEMSE